MGDDLHKNKLNAFTIMEVVITMIISSIVIFLAYSLLGVVNGYFNRSMDQGDLYTERLLLRIILSNDVDLCDSIKRHPDGMRMYTMNDSVSWSSREGVIQRNDNGRQKIFAVGGNHLTAYDLNPSGYVEAFHLSYENGRRDSVTFSFFKKYDLAVLINE